MRTPHRITLSRGVNIMGRYNPETDSYDTGTTEYQTVPCLVSVLSQTKVFEDYGNRTDKVISCRFMRPQAPFYRAEFEGRTYEPIETITAPIKGAVRLKEVSYG